MAKVYVLQHHPAEALGNIADALQGAALAWQIIRVFDGASVPANMKNAGGLIIMGGPQSVRDVDRNPFLRDEFRLTEDAIAAGLPVIGVCLGAQIIAAAVGAKIEKNPRGKEIGWHPIELASDAASDRLMRGLAPRSTVFHWHGEIFECPRGAVALASSEKTPCQAFRYGESVYGLQYHLEVTRESIASMAAAFSKELDRENLSGPDMIESSDALMPALELQCETVFGRWAGPIQKTIR
jgi:GMP synthase (glutamine-hydrolysing)